MSTNPEEQSEKIDDLSQIMGEAIVLISLSRAKDGGCLLTFWQPKDQTHMSFEVVPNNKSELAADTLHFPTDKKAYAHLSGRSSMISYDHFCRPKKS